MRRHGVHAQLAQPEHAQREVIQPHFPGDRLGNQRQRRLGQCSQVAFGVLCGGGPAEHRQIGEIELFVHPRTRSFELALIGTSGGRHRPPLIEFRHARQRPRPPEQAVDHVRGLVQQRCHRRGVEQRRQHGIEQLGVLAQQLEILPPVSQPPEQVVDLRDRGGRIVAFLRQFQDFVGCCACPGFSAPGVQALVSEQRIGVRLIG